MKKAFLAIFILVGIAGICVYVIKNIVKSMNELKVDPSFGLDSSVTNTLLSTTTSTHLEKSLFFFVILNICSNLFVTCLFKKKKVIIELGCYLTANNKSRLLPGMKEEHKTKLLELHKNEITFSNQYHDNVHFSFNDLTIQKCFNVCASFLDTTFNSFGLTDG